MKNASVVFNENTSHPELTFELTRAGASRFDEITGINTGRKLAIILDDRIIAAPPIQERISEGE